MPKAEPVLGYPSKTAAAVALHGQGLSADQIAARIGITKGNVIALLSSASRSPKFADRMMGKSARQTGWTLAKKKKAIRLYAKIVELVAAEIDVPPVELLTLWSKGTTPPIGSARVTEIGLDLAADTAAKPDPGHLADPVRLPSTQELVKDLPVGRDRPLLPAGGRRATPEAPLHSKTQVQLKNDQGLFLHWSGGQLTANQRNAWIGTREQAANIKAKEPIAANLREVPAPVWKPRDAEMARELRER